MITDPVNDFVCARVRQIRIAKEIRLQEMAERTGIPLGSYSCLETGRYRMSLANLLRILHALGTDILEVWPGRTEQSVEQVDDDYLRETVEEARAKIKQPPTIQDVLEAVAGAHDITTAQLASPDRTRHLSEARTMAAVIVKEETPHLTLVSLSRALNRDVSSLSHAIRRAKDRLEYDHSFRRQLEVTKRIFNDLTR